MKRSVLWVALIGVLLLTIFQPGRAQPQTAGFSGGKVEKIAAGLRQDLASMRAGEMTTVIVTLKEQADMTRIQDTKRADRVKKVVITLKAKAETTQQGLRAYLTTRQRQGKVASFTPWWVFNGLEVTATGEVILELAARPEVRSITPNEAFLPPETSILAQPEPNLSQINAPALWQLGYRGQGIVMANLDSGVYLVHPDLVSQWRGGTNSWFDPNGQHPDEPFDASGHGTWTMGVMVGREAGGTAVGVAPEARWAAVKIFNDQGQATTAGIHQAFQWILDPDNDPNTADAPQVVNNSWNYASPGCNLEFQLDLQALRATNILPVFAAGNAGPNPSTSVSPANNPPAFAVGGVNDFDSIYASSSRGPSDCGESKTTFPEIVAPAVGIHTTDLFGLYYDPSGTSLAAPHAAGVLALLLSAYPNLTADQQASALINSAADLGLPSPDDDFGFGRLDALAAFQWVADNQNPPPSPTPTASATPTPTPTSTLTATAAPPGVLLYLSSANSGSYTVGNLSGVSDEDVLGYNGSNFAMQFDGSDVGVGSLDLDAFYRLDGDSFLMSFDKAATFGSLGSVDDSDLLRFDASSLGTNTAGTFSMFFDASLAGLTTNDEDVDAAELLPDGRLIVSTLGSASLPGLSGTQQDEDLLAFTPASPGNYTSGTWAMYFDGSDVGLATNSGEDVDGVNVSASGAIYLTTLGAFSVDGLSGGPEDVFVCASPVTGTATACSFSPDPYFDGSLWGLAGNNVDAIALP
ncbi:MAG TPA: S8 family serine peptidase [Anaerolineales bacterium]|nr:S8 family serine peptidase [Anaerolineales bacterium]